MIIAVDFDGTCVEHAFPDIGADVPRAVEALQDLVKDGHQLILWTMRSDLDDGAFLTDAVNWFEKNEIPLWGVNANPQQSESGWSMSPKAYAHLYIDDAALGCPLIPGKQGDRPMVDWPEVMRRIWAMN